MSGEPGRWRVDEEAGLHIDGGAAVGVEAQANGTRAVGPAGGLVVREVEIAAAEFAREFVRGPVAAEGEFALGAQGERPLGAVGRDLVRIGVVAHALLEHRQEGEGPELDAEGGIGLVHHQRPAQGRAEESTRRADPGER